MEINGISFKQAMDMVWHFQMRRMKLEFKWLILCDFHPVKAFFIKRRFDRTRGKILLHEAFFYQKLGMEHPIIKSKNNAA